MLQSVSSVSRREYVVRCPTDATYAVHESTKMQYEVRLCAPDRIRGVHRAGDIPSLHHPVTQYHCIYLPWRPFRRYLGGADICSTQRGDSQSRWTIAATFIGSPHVQARHGPHGRHPEAEHEDIQADCGKQHMMRAKESTACGRN